MKKLISLNSIRRVRDFVEKANSQSGDVTLYSGRYVIDGRSIMGIFSLDLSQPITVECDNDTAFEEFEVYKINM